MCCVAVPAAMCAAAVHVLHLPVDVNQSSHSHVTQNGNQNKPTQLPAMPAICSINSCHIVPKTRCSIPSSCALVTASLQTQACCWISSKQTLKHFCHEQAKWCTETHHQHGRHGQKQFIFMQH
ncbi:hypothetical protein BJ741DRAFT_614683 [Chytriomyces cf. hyalinus JEL632]|nr:hypothetical protein BJ741DRAFT_614683 [Chytriomyces cf. hyalinus JEL632]